MAWLREELAKQTVKQLRALAGAAGVHLRAGARMRNREELLDAFLIETVGAGSTKGAIVDTEIGPPPSRAQVLGIITFAGATEFLDDRDFDSHRQDTLIEVDSPFDWWSSGAKRFFGWVVLDVKAFKMPVSVGGRPRSMLGWTKPVELSFQFEVAE